jgi:hypothetical protein
VVPGAGPGYLSPVNPPRPPGRFATDEPPPTGGTELSANEPALALLLNHFAHMQQQQMDQFQQMMMMMLQTFNGMHRDQMGLVHEELARIRELNLELASIKAQMAAQPRYPAPPAPPGAGAGPGPARSTNGQVPPRTSRPAAASSTAGTAPSSPSAQTGGPPGAAPRPAPVPPLPPPGVEIHDWLNERLAAVTQEQQTRWQKVMTLIRGGQG